VFLLAGRHSNYFFVRRCEFLASDGSTVDALDHEGNFLVDLLSNLDFQLATALADNVVEALESNFRVLGEAIFLVGLHLLSDNLVQVSARGLVGYGVFLAESNAFNRVVSLQGS